MKYAAKRLLGALTLGSILLSGMPVMAAPEGEETVPEDGLIGTAEMTGTEDAVTDPGQEELKRILSGLSWNNWRIAYQEGVTEQEIAVPYINKDGIVAYGMVKLYLPADSSDPVPLVFVPHYEAGEYSLEAVNYLRHGWAVASPLDLYGTINNTLLEDDLVFNNAALYTLRHLPQIDPQRVALAGSSAGGYTALMIDALQLGSCAVVANYAMVNPYYTFTQHFPQIDRFNRKYTAVSENGETTVIFPTGGAVTGCFQVTPEYFPGGKDYARWEELSPIGLCSDLSAPVMENHYTSDLLIPLDEVTRLGGYASAGDSIPRGFNTHMSDRYPGVLGRSFAELLPQNATSMARIMIETPYDEVTLPYDPQAFFQINILDDGPVEAYSGHYAKADYVFKDDSVFLSDMFARTLQNTEILTIDKAVLLLHRYMGDSPQLPVHIGVDETVYGSVTVYRNEIVEGLARYAQNHSYAELESVILQAMQTYPEDTLLAPAWSEIRTVIE